ncbi:unnamed protein product [Schistosoma rodhaini]|nr:unnamed protein product [Schistosoma rodhaini]
MQLFSKISRVNASFFLRMSTKRSDEEWKCVLNPEQYRVARLKGTEAPFTGEYYHNKEKGEYLCVCCGSKLFDSSSKFDSGSGWPSFYQVHGSNGRDDSQTNVIRTEDNSLDLMRIEISCKQCGAHLGHVFEDGPKPTVTLRLCFVSFVMIFSGSKVDGSKCILSLHLGA